MRDYSKKPNRFTFKLLYNGEPVTTVDGTGNVREAERDFDSPFNEPYNVQQFLDNRIIVPNGKPLMDYYKYTYLFENSWEAVELGEAISENFRLILRQGTEQFLNNLNNTDRTILMGEMMALKDSIKAIKTEYDPTQDYAAFQNTLADWHKGKTNTFTFVIIDRRSPIRNENGSVADLRDLNHQIDELKEREKFQALSQEDRKALKNLEAELSSYYTEREIFRHSISADDYSYNGKDFTPPLGIIWKDFNVNFKSPTEDRSTVEYADISEFISVSDKVSNLKKRIEKLKMIASEVEKTGDNIKVASIEADVRKIEREMSKSENVYFKGLRTLIKEYMNLEEYTNRFMVNREKNSNYYTNSSEKELIQESYM
jgi:hypothetical protein